MGFNRLNQRKDLVTTETSITFPILCPYHELVSGGIKKDNG